MSQTPITTIRSMLTAVLEETDDPDSRFKLRTSLQLLNVVEWNHDNADQLLQEAEIDDDVRSDLEDLGYLDSDDV